MPPRTLDSLSDFQTERPLTAQRLAQYVARGRCERHLRFALFPSEAHELLRRYGLEFEPLSPLLSKTGQEYEREQFEELARSERVVDLRGRESRAFIEELKGQTAERVFYYQPSMRGSLGGWQCVGSADIVRVERETTGRTVATVIDIKASRRETVGFRLQVAFYARLLRDALKQAGIDNAEIQGAVAARDSSLAEDGACQTFDLALFDDEIERLVAAADSDVARASRVSSLEARYHLRPACDGCPYNQLCFADTAERLDLSLIPHLTISEKRALHRERIRTARELGELLIYGERGALEFSPGREDVARRVSSRWPLGARLPVLAQRARAAMRRLDRQTEAKRYLVNADFGSLPDPGQYPDLIRVFIDAQRDYLEDRLYLVGARVVGPRGIFEVVETTSAPPRDETNAERELLVGWVQKLLPKIAQAADSERATLHVYTFAPRGERALLDALARHFDALCAVPAFYDLLTSRPALSQSMVSLLADEVRARLNLSPVCQNLYQVARELGFEWKDAGGADLRKIFRARVFDNRRSFKRDAADGLFTKEDTKTTEDDEPPAPFVWIESAARFGVEIPLEYAYAAWGLLKDSDEKDAHAQLKGFAGVTVEQIEAFVSTRLRAMQHIEESFAYKNRKVEKEPIDLSKLDEVEIEPEEIPLRRTLEDFLLLEHHARLQELLLHLAQRPRERVETGRAAILRCESYEKTGGEERARFRFSDEEGFDANVSGQGGMLKLRAGDWVVLNALADAEGRALPAWKLVRGRLAVVEEMKAEEVELRLMPMSFKNSAFRFPHQLFAPDAGRIYTIDEMADDLNSDKFLEACRHADTNHLYRWITNAEEGKSPRAVRPKRVRDAQEFAQMATLAQSPHGLTRAQNQIVGGHLTDRVLVVQGPPGTGKSHTLGFAVLARALAQASPAKPFRIAVLAKTHAAVRVALESIARRRRELLAAREGVLKTDANLEILRPLERLKLVKICSDAGEICPEGVEVLLPDGGEDASAAAQWEALLSEELLIVGGTPGGLYNLVKKGASKGRAVDWTGEHFDLVVVDEASQMGLAEALTAAAFLRADGQFIAVGDHRQMPPILAHAWDEESRRDLRRATPHLSIFEYLQKLGFARAALDESFRIPTEIADFLRRHIYAQDEIDFRSTNVRRLPQIENLNDGWLKAALAPEHAFVVVEHDEAGSQQSNEFEALLVEELVRVASDALGLDAAHGVGVVVPHRAQKALLQERLTHHAESIDTVERFQGGERELIVVSATVSDREFAASESSFLMEPRRLTVAVSRPTRKLIVIASRAIFDLIPADLDEYERGALWKHLRRESSAKTIWEGEVAGQRVWVRAI